MQLAQVRYYVELVLLFIGFMGNVFLWFVGDLKSSGGPAYFGVFMSSLVFVATARPNFPAKYKSTARTLSFFFMINFQESAICHARNVFGKKEDLGEPMTDDQQRLMRCGAFFALFSAYAIFFEAFVVPAQKVGSEALSKNTIKSLRGILFLVAAFLFFIAQCVAWGIKDVCKNQGQLPVPPLNVTPLTVMLVLIMGTIFGDRELLDLAVFITVFMLNNFKVIFNVPKGTTFKQDNFKSIWRAEMAFGFMAIMLVMFGQLQHCFRFCRNPDVSVAQRVKNPRMAAMIFMWIFAFAGAVCIYAHTKGDDVTMTEATHAWWASFAAFVVPVFCIIAFVTGCFGPAVLAGFLAVFINTHFAGSLLGTAMTGYVRGGAILCMITTFFLPLVVFSDNVEIAEDVEVYFEGNNKTPMWLCMLLGACGVLFWDDGTTSYHSLWPSTLQLGFVLFCAASSGDVNLYKLVGYVLLYVLTMPFMWPADRSSFQPTPPAIAFVIIGWATAAYTNFAFPGEPFSAFHEAGHEEMIEAQTAFIDGEKPGPGEDGSVARMYVAGDSGVGGDGGAIEVGGSITED